MNFESAPGTLQYRTKLSDRLLAGSWLVVVLTLGVFSEIIHALRYVWRRFTRLGRKAAVFR
jgi:hypothetical protein